jgi:hypothetical protein
MRVYVHVKDYGGKNKAMKNDFKNSTSQMRNKLFIKK